MCLDTEFFTDSLKQNSVVESSQMIQFDSLQNDSLSYFISVYEWVHSIDALLISSILFGHHLQPLDGSNEVLQLLKSHKEKLETVTTELRKRNEELEKEKVEGEKEKEALRITVDQLQTRLTQLSQQVPSHHT